MVTIPQYLAAVNNQLLLAGATVYQAAVGRVTATVAELNEQVNLGSYRYCVTITPVDAATAFVMEDFRQCSAAFSQTLKVPYRGWTTSVVVIAAVVAASADDGARAVAIRKPSATLGTCSQSLLVDLSTGHVLVPQSAPFWGAGTYSAIRKTMHQLFPAPQAVAMLPKPPL